MKVWIVTTGSYSDYSVLGVCSSREAVQKVIDTYPNRWNDWNDPEEFELDRLYTRAQRSEFLYLVRINSKTGDLVGAEKLDLLYGSEDDAHGTDINNNWYWYLWADSQYKAVKIAAERWAVLRASLPQEPKP